MRAPLSAKARAKYERGVKIARALYKDEGGSQSRGEIPVGEINHPTNQGGRFGRRVSRTGGAGPERQEHANHINDQRNARMFPSGGRASGRPGGTPSAARGPIAPSGPRYGGGGRNTQ